MTTPKKTKRRVEEILYVSPRSQLLFELAKKYLPDWDRKKCTENSEECWALLWSAIDFEDQQRINQLFESGGYNCPPDEKIERIEEPSTIKKILFTADLHIGSNRSSLQGFYESIEDENPGAVVIAGDLASRARATGSLSIIRKIVGNRPCAVSLGNHDFYGGYHHLLEMTIAQDWESPCRDNNIVLLDQQNAEWGDVTIVGGYGHYDLGLAWPNLILDGLPVTEDIYLKGFGWNDFSYIPKCAEFLKVNARAQAVGIAARLDQAIVAEKRVLMATHTCPWAKLNGHPRTGSYEDIFTGYSGNSLVGKEIEKRAENIEFLMCGHTHFPIKKRKIYGIPCLNVGADYGIFRGVLYDCEKKSIKWVGAPF